MHFSLKNSSGRSSLFIDLKFVRGFGSVGFENCKVPIVRGTDSLQIILKAKTYTLAEIEISANTATEIIKKAVDRLPSNLSDDKSILQGFFREIIRSDQTYDRLVEAAVDVLDKGYNPTSGNRDMQFKIRELRKSEDYADQINDSTLAISGISNDPEFGYTSKKPIMVGMVDVHKASENIKKYLSTSLD